MSDKKNLEPDLDFLRYADDVQESKSLKKFIDSGKEKRFRIRTKSRSSRSTSPSIMSSANESDDAHSLSSCQNEMFKTRKKEIQKRLGPDGCEEPPDQSGSSKENPRNYNDQSNQQELQFVRGQMQNALLRLRELEEQVKTIPQLEVKISILTQQKNQLVQSVGIEKEKLRESERENGKLRNKLKEVEILQDNNDELIKHIQELESIVDKVNCEVRSIAAQTDSPSLRNSTNQNRLHIDDHDDGQYDSSGSFDSTSSRNMNRRRRKPATKSVASGGFEYLENIVCYDRTCLRNVGIGTSVVTRDFGQTANVKGSRDALRVDKAVGNHVDSVSIAILAKPESRDKRSGKSRAFQCDASTSPHVTKTNDRGTITTLLPTHFPTKIEQMSNNQPNIQAISSSTQTTANQSQANSKTQATTSRSTSTVTRETKTSSTFTENDVTTTSCGPDHPKISVDQSNYVNWLHENSRSRRTQTTANQMTSTSTETDQPIEEEKKEIDQSQTRIDAGTDPIEELAAPQRHHHHFSTPPPLNETSSPPISLPEINQSEGRTEPREFDPFVNDENEIIYLFRSKSTDEDEGDGSLSGDSCGEGEMRSLRCKETRDLAIGPDEPIDDVIMSKVEEFVKNNPEEVKKLLGIDEQSFSIANGSLECSQNSQLDETENLTAAIEAETYTIVNDDSLNMSHSLDQSTGKDFSQQEYPLMTDIEERYELPENLIESCAQLDSDIKTLSPDDIVIDKALKKEWFVVSSKQNSSAMVVEDFLSCVSESSSKSVLPFILNTFDLNGNCALHYAISHANLDVVSVILKTEAADLNIFNKAGYTPVMLTALVDSNEKVDLSPLIRLFKGADLDLQSKKEGQTALMLACGHGRKDTVRLLLMNGCDVNAQDEEGSTALMCAAEHGHTEIVKLILENSEADCNLEDSDGSTALSIAMECGHRDIGVLLYAKMNFEE